MIVIKCNLFSPLSLFISLCTAFSQNRLPADTVVSINDVIWTKTEIEASFPGGEEAWNKFYVQGAEKNINALTDEVKVKSGFESFN
jgi:hypothetical protein